MSLTWAETGVLRLLEAGKTREEVEREVRITRQDLHVYLHRIRKKLGDRAPACVARLQPIKDDSAGRVVVARKQTHKSDDGETRAENRARIAADVAAGKRCARCHAPIDADGCDLHFVDAAELI
jgi:predicted transcriptional regulator